MNVETINVWAQLVTSIGVIVSLFYVAAQVRQNTRSARAVVVDSLARSMHDLAFEMAQNDQLLTTATMLKDWNSASEMERARIYLLCSVISSYSRMDGSRCVKGRLNAINGRGMTILAHGLDVSTVKTWWSMRRTFFAPGFRNYVENLEEARGVPSLAQLTRTEK